MPDILHRVGITASPDKVYRMLTEQDGLAGWWTTNVRAQAIVGTVSEFRFGGNGFNHMKIAELVPNQRVRWQCVAGGDKWIDTAVIFDLREEGGNTIVVFAQRGWREPVEFMHYCSTKWATYLLSLKSLCETGAGMPYPCDVDIG